MADSFWRIYVRDFMTVSFSLAVTEGAETRVVLRVSHGFISGQEPAVAFVHRIPVFFLTILVTVGHEVARRTSLKFHTTCPLSDFTPKLSFTVVTPGGRWETLFCNT